MPEGLEFVQTYSAAESRAKYTPHAFERLTSAVLDISRRQHHALHRSLPAKSYFGSLFFAFLQCLVFFGPTRTPDDPSTLRIA
jgi:hypothetical protein